MGTTSLGTYYANSGFNSPANPNGGFIGDGGQGNFAIRIRATPEPSTDALLAIAGVVGVAAWTRRQSSPGSGLSPHDG